MIDLSSPKIHSIIHLVLDLAVILFFVLYYSTNSFLLISCLVIGANLIDLDHFLSENAYQKGRCSLKSHLLHHWSLFIVWILGIILGHFIVRVIFSGIIAHILADGLDCFFMNRNKIGQ